MKNKIFYAIVIALVTLASCKKEFTERGALSGTTVDNYYNTADEIRSATSTLYSGLPWNGFQSRAMDDIGDVMAGNSYSGLGAEYGTFVNFTLSSTTPSVGYAWQSFYKIGGWSGSLIKAFELKKTLGGKKDLLDAAIAECHFMRGTVYFYIAKVWGDAPIVDDPGAVALSGNYNIPRYLKADVFKYALKELQLAEAGLPESDIPGRLTKYSAKGMMAKLYLYLGDYDNAKAKAQEVMNSGKYSLVRDFQAMFNSSAYNNNSESLFSIQYQLSQNPWGTGNQLQCDRGPSNLSTDVSNMWELFIPTLDARDNIWTDPKDKRRAGSMMTQGWSMPSWKPKNANADYNTFMANGYVYDTIQATDKGGEKNGTRSNIAKYVVGPGSKYGGEEVLGMNTKQNYMVLRYADVLLIYAEAVLGSSTSTTDASALKAVNDVRNRAGLDPLASLTKDLILKERRAEFAFEGDYWYDIQRQGFAKAKQIIEAQDRGTVGSPLHVTFIESYMYLPIPAGEILQDPELAKPAIAYPFTK